MARFETWGDVARLFIGAAFVGVLLILLLTAEARKLEEREEALVAVEEESDKVVAEAGDISALTGLRTVWSKLAQFIRFFISDTLLTGKVFMWSQDLKNLLLPHLAKLVSKLLNVRFKIKSLFKGILNLVMRKQEGSAK